jgi:hypothetical protein
MEAAFLVDEPLDAGEVVRRAGPDVPARRVDLQRRRVTRGNRGRPAESQVRPRLLDLGQRGRDMRYLVEDPSLEATVRGLGEERVVGGRFVAGPGGVAVGKEHGGAGRAVAGRGVIGANEQFEAGKEARELISFERPQAVV